MKDDEAMELNEAENITATGANDIQNTITEDPAKVEKKQYIC